MNETPIAKVNHWTTCRCIIMKALFLLSMWCILPIYLSIYLSLNVCACNFA